MKTDFEIWDSPISAIRYSHSLEKNAKESLTCWEKSGFGILLKKNSNNFLINENILYKWYLIFITQNLFFFREYFSAFVLGTVLHKQK